MGALSARMVVKIVPTLASVEIIVAGESVNSRSQQKVAS